MQSKSKNFEGITIYVGMDVHLKSWSIAPFTASSALKKFTMSPPSPDQLAKTLQAQYPGATFKCCYEAGYCGFWIQRELEELGISTIVVNAADVPLSNKDLMRKTDSRDASKIGRELRSGNLTALYVPSKEAEEDRSIVRFRGQLVKDERRVKQRIKMYLHFKGIEMDAAHLRWSNKSIAYLKAISEELKDEYLRLSLDQLCNLRQSKSEITKKIKQLSQSEKYNALSELLRSVPGISYVGSMMLITELIDIKRFSTLDDLCSYIGLVPDTKNTGDLERSRGITNRANKRLRTILIESAWIAIRQDSVLSLAYSTYTKRMRGQKAIVKVARRLLSRIRFVWLSGEKYKTGVS